MFLEFLPGAMVQIAVLGMGHYTRAFALAAKGETSSNRHIGNLYYSRLKKDVVLCISARFRTVWNFLPINVLRHKTPLEQHMCDICHFNAIYVPKIVLYMVYAVTYMAVTSDRCTAFGDVMSQFTEFAKEAFGRLTILSVTFTTHNLLM